jgi:hypothetical protein
MTQGSQFAVEVAEAIVASARAGESRGATVAARTVVRMASATDPLPLYVPARRRPYGLLIALGVLAVSLGLGIFGR